MSVVKVYGSTGNTLMVSSSAMTAADSFADSFSYRTRLDEADLTWFKALDAQCFVSTPQDAETYLKQVGNEACRLITQQDTRLGGLCLLPMGQWFGERRVPMMGVASVGIAPEHRSKGVAIALMQAAVRESYERGMAISTLYPAVQSLYAKAGYGQAGTYGKWSISTQAIRVKSKMDGSRLISMEPIAPDVEVLTSIYQKVAPKHQGWCDRHPSIWQQKVHQDGTSPLYAYRIGSQENPQGYVLFVQFQKNGQNILRVLDWVACSVDAGLTLWAFLQGYRSQVAQIHWRGGVFDPMVNLLPEQTATVVDVERWMSRIVNVPLALESRGYPLAVAADLHLKIHDSLIAENSGQFVLTVKEGKGTVTPGGTGDVTLTINSLASLYTGFFTPQQLQWMGKITGSDNGLAIATQLFAGSSPALIDFF